MILFDFVILYWSDRTNSTDRLSWTSGIEKFFSIEKILKFFYNWFESETIITIQELLIIDRLFKKKYRENILYSARTNILVCGESQNIDICFTSNLLNNLIYKNIIYIEYIFYTNWI